MINSETTEANLPKSSKIGEFWRRNQTLFFYLPVSLAALFGCYIVLKALDPRIGIEGFGDLFGYLLNGVRATLILLAAWLLKRWCWFDIHQRTELELFDEMRKGSKMAFWIVVRDRCEWVLALSIATYWFTR